MPPPRKIPKPKPRPKKPAPTKVIFDFDPAVDGADKGDVENMAPMSTPIPLDSITINNEWVVLRVGLFKIFYKRHS